MWTIFKSLLNLLQYCFCFGSDACGTLAPQPGIQPIPPALEVKVNHWKTTGKPGKSLLPTLTKLFVCLLFTSKSYIYKSLTRHMVWYVCSHSVGSSFYFFLISFEAQRFLIIALVDSLEFSKCSGKKKVMSPTDRENFIPTFPIWKFLFLLVA